MLPSDRRPARFVGVQSAQRRRRRRHRPWIFKFWWILPLAAAGLAVPWALSLWHGLFTPRHVVLTGYLSGTDVVRREFARFEGKAPDGPAVEEYFARAAGLASQGQYSSAVVMLETLSESAPLPAVFNDLGVLYVTLNDGSRAARAFREALARDLHYAPVRENVKRFKLGGSAEPVTREVEPNASDQQANVISLGRSVDAEITPDVDDVDCFYFVSPPAPRDLLLVELANRSQTLAPRLQLFDTSGHLADWSKESLYPGTSLREVIAPPPNTAFYIRVDGLSASSGAYSLTVSPMKAYDPFEPNDDILRATKIAPGQTVQANIMDGDDTDYYSFRGAERGSADIEIANRSKTLIPALTSFTPEMAKSGFGPMLTAPGSDLHFSMKVEPGRTYYIQVWGQAKTAGDYSLTVK